MQQIGMITGLALFVQQQCYGSIGIRAAIPRANYDEKNKHNLKCT